MCLAQEAAVAGWPAGPLLARLQLYVNTHHHCHQNIHQQPPHQQSTSHTALQHKNLKAWKMTRSEPPPLSSLTFVPLSQKLFKVQLEYEENSFGESEASVNK